MKTTSLIFLMTTCNLLLETSLAQPPVIVSVKNGSSMCYGTVVLSAISNKGTVYWYASETDETVLGTGSIFETPNLYSSHTYFAQAIYEGTSSERIPVSATIVECSVINQLGETLKGKWYHTRTTGGIGGVDENEPIEDGRFTEIIPLEGKDSVIWKNYINCRPVFQKKCKIGYKFFSNWDWKPYIEGPDELNVILWGEAGSFSIGQAEARDPFFYHYTSEEIPSMPVIPAIIQVSNGQACEGNMVTLKASSNRGTVNWFSSDTGGASLAVGIEINVNVDKTTLFYAEASDGECKSTNREPVSAIIAERCESLDSIIGLISGRWYLTGIGTEESFEALLPIAGDSVVLNRIHQTDSISGSLYHYCEVMQQYSYRLLWDSSASLGTKTWILTNSENVRYMIEVSGNSIILAVDSVNAVYFVLSKIDTFTLDPMPAIINTYENVNRRCGPGSVSLQAQANIGLIRWYDNATGGEILGMGTVFFTPSINETTTYYTDVISNGCVSNQRAPIHAVISDCLHGGDSVAHAIQGRWYLISKCCGYPSDTQYFTPVAGDSVIIKRFPELDSISWTVYHNCKVIEQSSGKISYRETPGGENKWMYMTMPPSSISVTSGLDGTHMEVTMEVVDGFIYEYVRIDTFTITDPPQMGPLVHGTRCGEGRVMLGASGNPGTIRWFTYLSDEMPIAIGNIYETPILQSTTTYYVEAELNGCETDRMPVIATIVKGDTCETSVHYPENELQLFPNPTNGNVRIVSLKLQDSPVTVNIINNNGVCIESRVFSSFKQSIDIDLANLKPGVYILQVIQNNRVVNYRIVKQ